MRLHGSPGGPGPTQARAWARRPMSRPADSAYDAASARKQPAARPTMDLHGDSGQSTVEWLALMAMLIALAGVLITTMPGVGHTIVDTVGKLIRSVVP